MRKVLVFVLLVVLGGCLGLPLVKAEIAQFGNTVTAANQTALTANKLYGCSFVTSGLANDVYSVLGGAAYVNIPAGSGTINLKMVIVNSTLGVVAVSDPIVASGATDHFVYFDFPVGTMIYKSMLNYTLCLITNSGAGYYFLRATSGGTYYIDDASNSYVNPSDPSDVSFTGTANKFVIYLDLESVAPSPTPSPSPVPTVTMPPFNPPSVTPPSGGGVSPSPSGFNTDDFGSSFYWIFLILGSVVAFMFGLFELLGDKGNKAVNVLIAVVSLVVFVVVLFAIGVL